MKLNASKIALAAMAALIAAGSLSACQYGVDGKGKTAAQKERHKCKGSN